MSDRTQQSGVVLLVVLSILAIVGMLLLQASLTAKDEVAKAKLLLDRARATADLRTAETRLTLALLTRPWFNANPRSPDIRAQRWRFDGVSFKADGAEMSIQDEGGLFVMPQPGYTSGLQMLPSLLEELRVEPFVTDGISRRLTERLQSPRALPLQDQGELLGVEGLSRTQLERLRAVSTLYPVQKFNPVLAPTSVLNVLYSGANLEAIVALRDSGGLDASSLSRATGAVDTDLTAFFPGPVFRINLHVKRNDVVVGRETTLVIDPYIDEPVKRWVSRRNTMPTQQAQ